MKQTPFVTIIMATYNRASFIRQSLVSIVQQSFKNWECIIINDGGTDNTKEVISDLLVNDSRLSYLKRTPDYKKGLPGSRNMGLDKAKGEYIIFFDDDDIIHPQNLEIGSSILKNNEAYYFCRYDKQAFKIVDDIIFDQVKEISSTVFRKKDLDKMITGEIPFASCCVMWKKECFDKIRFNEELMYAEEWECYSRILTQGTPGVAINTVLYYNRKHHNSNTGEFQKKDKVRMQSQIDAAILVIENLHSKKLFNEKLKKFFVRMSIELKSIILMNKSLEASEANHIERLQYKIGYKIYPILKPIFYLKGKI